MYDRFGLPRIFREHCDKRTLLRSNKKQTEQGKFKTN